MSKKRGDGYKVGYGKPPKDKRFKKGAPSPNPHGRPPKIESIHASVLRCLAQEIKVTTTDGEVRDMQKRDVIAERLVQKAANGDMQATKILCQIDEDHIHREAQMADEEEAKAQSLPPITELVEAIFSAQVQACDLKEYALHYSSEEGQHEQTPLGRALMDMIQGLKGGHIKTADAYKSALPALMDAIDDMALGYLIRWNPDLKKSDLA